LVTFSYFPYFFTIQAGMLLELDIQYSLETLLDNYGAYRMFVTDMQLWFVEMNQEEGY